MAELFDVIVIGGGFSGAYASVLSSQKKLRTMLVKQAPAFSSFFSGSFDILRNPYPEKESSPLGTLALQKLLRAWTEQNPSHIYSRLSEIIHSLSPEIKNQSMDVLFNEVSREFFSAFDVKTKGNGSDFLKVLSPIGQFKSTAYALDTVVTIDDLKAAAAIKFVSIAGLTDYPISLLEKECTRQGYFGSSLEIRLNLKPIAQISTLDVAQYLDTEAGQQDLLKQLPEIENGLFVFAPCLGLKSTKIIVDAIKNQKKSKAAECLSQVPSVPGLRIQEQINSILMNRVVSVTSQVVTLQEKEDHVCLTCSNGESYLAKKVILATGKRSYLTQRRGQDKIHDLLGLRFFDGRHYLQNESSQQLTTNCEGDSQRIYSAGIQFDSCMRPFDQEKKWSRVHLCGHILSGFDFAVENCGFGVSALSGKAAILSV